MKLMLSFKTPDLEKIAERCREGGHGSDATILHVYSNQIVMFLQGTVPVTTYNTSSPRREIM